MATTSASWDSSGFIEEGLILGELSGNKRKAERILNELTRAPHSVFGPVLVREGDGWRIDRRVIDFGRDGSSWCDAEVDKVLERDGFRCRYCGAGLDAASVTFDHIFPRSRGGGDKPDNLVVCCMPCNLRKSDRTPDEADMPLLPPQPSHSKVEP